AYGWPAVLGEYGLPNAGQSHDAFLGRWLASYEAALTCILAEDSLGFLNFYLNCGMGHVDAPEWGMVRPDYTEKPAALAWKRWNWLAQRLRPDELLPFDGALLFDPTVRYGNPQFISQLGRLYLNLLREGLPTALLSPADLARLRETKRLPTVVFAPEEGRTAAVRAALDHLSGWGVQVADSLDAFRDALRARLPVRALASGAQAFYARRLQGGRWLVAAVENDGKPVVFRVADHAYELALPEGRSALLVVTRQGLPELIAACGPVKMDGRTVVDGPAEGYAVWAGHGRSLATEGATDLWAEDQQAVTASFSLPDDLRSRRWHLEADKSVPPDVLSLTRSLLVARGLKLDRSAPNTIVLCGPQWAAEPTASERRGILARRGLRVLQAGPYRRLYVGDHWLEDPWAGFILVEQKKGTVAGARHVYVFGLTQAGLCVAVRRLASLRALRDYLTAPFAPLRSGAE
ncbi:MAG: hypothetical protein J7M26_04825, partial [Armatimonadetes bacterium]|nr:hypothetical protein [Armatimonadota bacterium]